MQLSRLFTIYHKLLLLFVACICASFSLNAGTADKLSPQALQGHWLQAPAGWQFADLADLQAAKLPKVSAPRVTGGSYVYEAPFILKDGDPFVIDFKNASVLAQFNHFILDSAGVVVADANGGIASNTDNPFLLRHARVFNLQPGSYKLITLLESPYFIAQPQPYVDSLAHYQQDIKWGDLLALVSLGVLFSLGVYYAILAAVRKQTAEITYAVFIFCNLIFNSMTMLVLPDLLGVHWFYLAGAPILVSNIAYVFFVMSLLHITATTHPKLHAAGKLIIGVMLVFLLAALFLHHWIIELARYGVGLMLGYGLVAGIYRAREGFAVAKLYLVAIFAFGLIGSYAISSSDLEGIYTIYIEHIGLLAVTVEVLLIGLVLGYQFAQVHRDKEHNLNLLQMSLRIAHSDALTGLPNRYALDESLRKLSPTGSLTFIDIDNLKLYNDRYGHSKGDELLQTFARVMADELKTMGRLHRIGGDEFAITSEVADEHAISSLIKRAIELMHSAGFAAAGASHGTVKRSEAENIADIKDLADQRMYNDKRIRKESAQQLELQTV